MSKELYKLTEQSLNGQNEVFCPAPFFHMYVHSSELPKVCCAFSNQSYYTKKDVVELVKSSPNRELTTEWKNDYYKNIRTDILNGKKVKGCTRCYQTERFGGYSDRIIHNEKLQKYLKQNSEKNINLDIENGSSLGSPINLDLRPGNLCNLQCRMCGPGSSTQLNKEWKKLPKSWNLNGFDERRIKNWSSDENLEFLLRNIDSTGMIKFLGGEPTIMPEVHKIMDHLIENNLTDVELFFTSNLTNNNAKFLDKIKKFKKIKIAISADGIGKVLEYIRHPIHWDTFKDNISKYSMIDSVENNFDIQYTIQAYNIHNILPTLKWIRDFKNEGKLGDKMIYFSPEVLEFPEYLSFKMLPKWYRDYHIQKCLRHPIMKEDFVTSYGRTVEHLERMLNSKDEPDPVEFIGHTVKLDISRNQHIKDYLPELYDIYRNDYIEIRKKLEDDE